MRLSRRAALLAAVVVMGPALPSLAGSPGPAVVESVVDTAALALGESVTALTQERLVGVTWTSGSPQVRVRWHTPQGWTPWEVPEDDSATPEPAERAGTLPGTEPLWRPAGADRVAVQVTGAATGLSLVRVLDGAVRGSGVRLGAEPASASTALPLVGTVMTRSDWGADERMRRSAPEYAPRVSAVVVHHTAGRNDYAAGDVPALLRADYAYHVRARGWSDLGYNLVVDRFGRVWEGRAGGLGRPVVGAHAQGFNTGTLGVSVLGDMTKAQPSPAVLNALSRVAAFAGSTWGFDPRSNVTLTSGGSPKYSAGRSVVVRRVFGHQQTSYTACPGVVQDRLPELRQVAYDMLGAPVRINDVAVTGAPVHAPTPVLVDAGLNRAADWSIAVRDPRGTIVRSTFGTGSAPHLDWNGLVSPAIEAGVPGLVPAMPGEYEWAVRATDSLGRVDRRTGRFAVGLPVVPVG